MEHNRGNTYPLELWRNGYSILRKYGNKISSKYAKEFMTSHPDYPSLVSLIDFFHAGNLRYEAFEADESYIHEFNYPLLAHIRHPGQEFMYQINHPSEWNKKGDLTQFWSGIVVFPELGSKWHTTENDKYRKDERISKKAGYSLLVGSLAVLLSTYFRSPGPLYFSFGLLTLVGLTISILALGTELGFQNQLVKQVCGTISSGGCEDVLKSAYAKEYLGVTPADASLVYFSSQFIYYFLCLLYPKFFTGQLIFILVSSVITVWSLYTQGVKVKKWCALCLMIVTILLLENAVFISMPIMKIQLEGLVLLAIIFLILLLALLPIKRLLKQNISNETKLAQLRSWKMDPTIFTSLLDKERQIDTQIWSNDLILGNPNAPTLVTIACNPYCPPCSTAHKTIDKLLHNNYNKIKIQLRFLFDNTDNSDSRKIAVRAILRNALEKNTNSEIEEMTSDWFNWVDYERWSTKWKPNNNLNVDYFLEKHTAWVKDNEISFTPTIFINGKKMPGRYLISDLEVLIPELTESEILDSAL